MRFPVKNRQGARRFQNSNRPQTSNTGNTTPFEPDLRLPPVKYPSTYLASIDKPRGNKITLAKLSRAMYDNSMQIFQTLSPDVIRKIEALSTPTLYAFFVKYLKPYGLCSPNLYNAYQGKKLKLATYIRLLCALSRIPGVVPLSQLRIFLPICPTVVKQTLQYAIRERENV